MRVAKNRGAREGVVFELGAVAREKGFVLRPVETGEQHMTRLRLYGVYYCRNLVNSLALAEQRFVQADSCSALEIDLELGRHARECTKALPLR